MSAAIPRRRGTDPRPVGSPADESASVDIFGFWLFLMSDAIVFALLFGLYGTMVAATADGPQAGQLFDMTSVFVETMLLLTSSFTFGLADIALKYDKRRQLVGLMIVTLILGWCFIIMEVDDFLNMFAAGGYPSTSAFLSSFFSLVPLHGAHVAAGTIWMVVLLIQMGVFGVDRRVKVNIRRLALFWHFLDIVWIGIFSVVYLQGLAR